MINTKIFDPNRIKIELKSQNIIIYYIGYITTKYVSYRKINSVNPLQFIIDKADGYTEENNENKHLALVFTD